MYLSLLEKKKEEERSWSQWDYLNKDQTKTGSPRRNTLQDTYLEKTSHILIRGSRQGRFQPSLPPILTVTPIFPLKGDQYSIVSQKLKWHFYACLCMISFLFFNPQLNNPTFSFPLLPLFFFPYAVVRCWIGISNVFQVSAQRCISHLRVELWQAAAPGASEPVDPTPTLLPCGPCPHQYTGNGCNLHRLCRHYGRVVVSLLMLIWTWNLALFSTLVFLIFSLLSAFQLRLVTLL